MPLTLVVERPDGVEFRRNAVADQGLGGHALTLPLPGSAPTGTWHVRAFTDPKRPPVGETTFLVEDYVPDRIEFDLTAPSGTHLARRCRPRSMSPAVSFTARRRPTSISKAR